MLSVASASTIMKPICDVRSLLLANDELAKHIRRRELILSGMKRSPWEALLCCYSRRLFSVLISSSMGFIA